MSADQATLTAPALTEDSTSRFVQTKRWKLHYNEAGSGHPLILMHGTGPGATGWSNFSPNIGPLSRHYRVIALDFPGWGKSDTYDPAEGPRGPAQVEAVLGLLDELGIEKAALVGNSMGGGATMEFTAKHTDRVSHVITMGAGIIAGPNYFTPGGMSEGFRIIRETYTDPSPENFRRLVQVMVYDPSFATPELLKARSAAALANPQHLQNWLRTPPPGPGVPPPGGGPEVTAKLARVTLPALFIHGRDDRVVPMEGSLRALTVMPNSQLHVFNRCGHWAQIEHANAFNGLIHAFISDSSVPAAKAGFGG
jgi:2-hydroxy-6-oxonona-2,4-dienedioate hydrolase